MRVLVSFIVSVAVVYQLGACPCGCWENSRWRVFQSGGGDDRLQIPDADEDASDRAGSPKQRLSADDPHDHIHGRAHPPSMSRRDDVLVPAPSADAICWLASAQVSAGAQSVRPGASHFSFDIVSKYSPSTSRHTLLQVFLL